MKLIILKEELIELKNKINRIWKCWSQFRRKIVYVITTV